MNHETPAASPAAMTQTEFATHRGVGKSAVSNWKRDGLLVFVTTDDGRELVDVAASDAILDDRLDPTRGRPSTAGIGGDLVGGEVKPVNELQAVRLDFMREQTIRKRLDNDKLAGQLVARAEFEARAADWARRVRERMQGLVGRHRERLAAERDPRALAAFLAGEIDAVFSALADDAEAEPVDQAVEPVEAADDDLVEELVAELAADAG